MKYTDKPVFDAQGRIRYQDAIRYLEHKYQFDSSDFNKSRNHFGRWCEKHEKKLEGISQDERQVFFKEYCKAADGDKACPDPENFWHWMVELVSPPGERIRLPASFRLNIPKVLAKFDTEVAPKREAEAAALSNMLNSVMAFIPEDMRDAAKEQYAVKSAKLKPYVRTILGYFEAEFGASIKLDMRRN